MKRVLVLGAGLVTGPMVKYLLDAGYHVTVASRTASKAQALVGDHPNPWLNFRIGSMDFRPKTRNMFG